MRTRADRRDRSGEAETTIVLVQGCPTPYGEIYIAATPDGLCRTTIPGQTLGDLLTWLERRLPGAQVAPADGALAGACEALTAYFDGVPLPELAVDLHGTPFQRSVWRAVMQIPFGETRSYAEVGRAIGYPLAGRAVGAANAVNPLPFVVPCHRVIGADGSIKGYPGDVISRRLLLELEGALPVVGAAPLPRPLRSGQG